MHGTGYKLEMSPRSAVAREWQQLKHGIFLARVELELRRQIESLFDVYCVARAS
jgi:hypothetical protein